MARNVAYYIDPEEERRRQEAEIAEAFPQANLGVAPVPRLPVDAADASTPRMTDRTYPPQSDAWARGEPTPEELAADEAEEAGDAEFPRIAETDPRLGRPLREDAARPSVTDDWLWAQTLLEDAPAAVDKTAANVSAQQKGVPAKLSLTTDTADERGWADDLAEQVRRRVLDKPEATTTPLHQKAEDFASQSLDPREGFSRERASGRAAELYGNDEGPGRYWEDELLSRRNRVTDNDVQKGFLLQSLMHGNDYGMQFRQMMRHEQAGFEQDLDKARDKDFGNRRVSRGMAEAIAATGQISPEAAVKLRMNDPLVKNFGQFASQGGRAEGQALGREKAQMDHAFDLIRSDKVDDRTRGLAMLQSLTTLGSAEIRAQALEQMTPEQILALKGSWMASHLRVPKEVGEAVVAGDTSKLTPEQKERADKFRPVVESAAADARVRGRVVGDQVKEGAGAEVKQENAVLKSIALAQNDQKFAEKWQKDWHAAEMPLKQAIKGWSAMSPAGQKAFTQWTQTQQGGIVDFAHIGDQWNKYNLPPEDQIHASRVLEAINSYVKANAGSAVTGSEWDRIAHRTGLATGTWAPFNNPEVVGTFLRDSAAAMTQSRSDYERIMGGWK